jgi:hypothetical protein
VVEVAPPALALVPDVAPGVVVPRAADEPGPAFGRLALRAVWVVVGDEPPVARITAAMAAAATSRPAGISQRREELELEGAVYAR